MTPWRVLPYGINYNNQLLKGDEAPKTFEELLLPKWKAKIRLGQSRHPCDDAAIRAELGKASRSEMAQSRRRMGKTRTAHRPKVWRI